MLQNFQKIFLGIKDLGNVPHAPCKAIVIPVPITAWHVGVPTCPCAKLVCEPPAEEEPAGCQGVQLPRLPPPQAGSPIVAIVERESAPLDDSELLQQLFVRIGGILLVGRAKEQEHCLAGRHRSLT